MAVKVLKLDRVEITDWAEKYGFTLRIAEFTSYRTGNPAYDVEVEGCRWLEQSVVRDRSCNPEAGTPDQALQALCGRLVNARFLHPDYADAQTIPPLKHTKLIGE